MSNNTQLLDKPLPSSPASERTILGAILLDNQLIAQAAEKLQPEHFHSPLHRFVFNAMLALFAESRKIDPVLIGEKMRQMGIGAVEVSIITNLTYGIPHFSDISEYIQIVFDKAKVREIIKAAAEIQATALDDSDVSESVLNFAQSRINDICADSQKRGFETVGELAIASVHRKHALGKTGETITGLPSGFKALDWLTNGWKKTDLIIVAARPSMGKSALVLNCAENACQLVEEAVVAVFSLEMSKEQLTDRLICSMARVDQKRYERNLLNDREQERVGFAVNRLQSMRIEIDDTPAISPVQARSKAMMIRAKYKRLDLIVVDYMQLMSGSKKTESRQQEVSAISRELKSLAKEMDAPVIALSQLSRAPEARNPPRPLMSDLRESGSIEQDADIVAFIYREHYYKPDANPGEAELIIGKNRNGATGTVKLDWIGEFTRFENC